jgi:ribosomal protein S12 methylthiotransferase accessory factor YcaO
LLLISASRVNSGEQRIVPELKSLHPRQSDEACSEPSRFERTMRGTIAGSSKTKEFVE